MEKAAHEGAIKWALRAAASSGKDSWLARRAVEAIERAYKNEIKQKRHREVNYREKSRGRGSSAREEDEEVDSKEEKVNVYR